MLPILREHWIRPLRVNRECWGGLNRALDDFLSDFSPLPLASQIDVYEDEKNLYVEAELAGFKQDEIEVTLEDGLLHLQAERRDGTDESKPTYYVRERRRGTWSRIIQLPVAVEQGNTKAIFKDGVLKITLEKQQQHKAHKIEVH